jgi:hypothetical protein
MSFTASGGATLSGDVTRQVGWPTGTADTSSGASASFVVTTTADTTFSGVFHRDANTATFDAASITVQVY